MVMAVRMIVPVPVVVVVPMPVVVPMIFAAVVVDVSGLAMGGVQELGLELGDPLQVEPAAAEDHVQGHV